jgi:hypothetical protein
MIGRYKGKAGARFGKPALQGQRQEPASKSGCYRVKSQELASELLADASGEVMLEVNGADYLGRPKNRT